MVPYDFNIKFIFPNPSIHKAVKCLKILSSQQAAPKSNDICTAQYNETTTFLKAIWITGNDETSNMFTFSLISTHKPNFQIILKYILILEFSNLLRVKKCLSDYTKFVLVTICSEKKNHYFSRELIWTT